MHKLLIINLGSTSTKIAVCEDENILFSQTVRHESNPEFRTFTSMWDQYELRRDTIIQVAKENGHELSSFSTIVARGAPVRPMNSGCYAINQSMVDDARSEKYGRHPCSVGCLIAFDLGRELGIPALTVDAPCIDELIDEARYTGWKGVERKSFYQALNQKAIGRRLASAISKEYDEMNAIIVHMGGGMSIAAHEKGRVSDVNNGLDGDGPLAPERAGTLPVGEVLKAAYSGKYSHEELYAKVNGKGGLFDLVGSKDCMEICDRIEKGDKDAEGALNAMIYQIAKSIGAASVTLRGNVDAIAFTGGLAHSEYIVDGLKDWCGFIAPIHVFPGEDEILSLCEGALLALRKERPIQQYGGEA